jgi:hypothetical protein
LLGGERRDGGKNLAVPFPSYTSHIAGQVAFKLLSRTFLLNPKNNTRTQGIVSPQHQFLLQIIPKTKEKPSAYQVFTVNRWLSRSLSFFGSFRQAYGLLLETDLMPIFCTQARKLN